MRLHRYPKLYDQHYKRLLLKCHITGQNFRDDRFPPNDSSIWRVNKPNIQGTIEWKRVKDICPKPHLFVYENGQAQPQVVQGIVGNCWLVSTLTVLASHPKLLKKVIPRWKLQDWVHSSDPGFVNTCQYFNDNEHHPGIFRFRFYHFGQWIEVVIDDYLPTINGQLIFAHGRNPNEIWCSLLEKAYAKLCGCYEALDSGSVADALVDLTGFVPETFEFKKDEKGLINNMNKEQLMKFLQNAHNNDALMSCSIYVEDSLVGNGLIPGHAYGITRMQTIKCKSNGKDSLFLLQLHNPWGSGEWNGAWSDTSPKWKTLAPTERKKINLKVEDDGYFWMSFNDFIDNFSNITISRQCSRWHNQMFRGSWSVKNNTADTRNRHPEVQGNLTIGFVCLKVEENRVYRIHKPTYDLVSFVTYLDAREITSTLNLKEGRYILIPSTYDAGEESKFLLRLFSDRYLNVKLLEEDAPKQKFYHSLIYPENKEFVGMSRIKIMDIRLTRDIKHGHFEALFSDFVFYVRDPSNAKVHLRLFENVKGKKQCLGEVEIKIQTFSADEREGKIFEECKPFVKLIHGGNRDKKKTSSKNRVYADIGMITVRVNYSLTF
ncbi:12113_t:CDS:2 [Ambispora gerdemannii]|uniref:12113_t:CDS:1 n=1 Tax=Ambispora gerdemannii TaxID=144530 RepID=A0A9N9GI08_9GLOM|nr:12113_t:CDS:2 [Ambispora gerdemannii]